MRDTDWRAVISKPERDIAPETPGAGAYQHKPWEELYPSEWRAMPQTEFGDLLSMFRAAVARAPDAAAIHYFDKTLTYDDLDRLSDALGCWLEQQGLKSGDRAAVILQNVPQFIIFVLAAWKCGGIPVPSNPLYRPAELAKLFVDCRPKIVLVEDGNMQAAREALRLAGLDAAFLSTSAHEFQTRGDSRALADRLPTPSGAVDFMDALSGRQGSALTTITPQPGPLGLLLYTSGTTGLPKGAMLSHASMAHNAQAMRNLVGLNANSRILAIAPLFHITGFICHFAAILSPGCSLILHYRFNPAVVLDAIREYRPTYMVGAITAYNALIATPGIRREDFASFESMGTGGAPVPSALHEKINGATGLPLQTAYGMTETTAQAAYALPRFDIPIDPTSGAISVGIPTPGTEVLIVDDSGAPVPVGTRGELWMRGPQIMQGYWQKPEDTAATLAGGWLHSGDIAVMDEAGWLYLVDRKKDVIIASGFKIWPREVEDVLYAHPAVREAAVVGVPEAYRGETVKACVSLNAGHAVTVEELLAHCRERLTGYKQPRILEIVAELPKTVTGKIQRNVVRDPSISR